MKKTWEEAKAEMLCEDCKDKKLREDHPETWIYFACMEPTKWRHVGSYRVLKTELETLVCSRCGKKIVIPKQLDEKGRCCGRKPTVYKSWSHYGGPGRYCLRCGRVYDLETGEQIRGTREEQRTKGKPESTNDPEDYREPDLADLDIEAEA